MDSERRRFEHKEELSSSELIVAPTPYCVCWLNKPTQQWGTCRYTLQTVSSAPPPS